MPTRSTSGPAIRGSPPPSASWSAGSPTSTGPGSARVRPERSGRPEGPGSRPPHARRIAAEALRGHVGQLVSFLASAGRDLENQPDATSVELVVLGSGLEM